MPALCLAFLSLAFLVVSGKPAPGCTPCEPGFGLVEPCYDTVPSVCKPCPKGTFSPPEPHFSPCAVCSECGLGLYADKQCTPTSDTLCDSCKSTRGVLNDDFVRSCLLNDRGMALDLAKHVKKHAQDVKEWLEGEENMDSDSDSSSNSDEMNELSIRDEKMDFYENLKELDGPKDGKLTKFDMMGVGPQLSIQEITDDVPEHKFKQWNGEKYVTHSPIPMVPSRDAYPSSVSAELQRQRNKLWLLVSVAAVILVASVLLASALCCLRQRNTQSKCDYLQDRLTDQDRLLIKDSAARLSKPGVNQSYLNPLAQLLDGES